MDSATTHHRSRLTNNNERKALERMVQMVIGEKEIFEYLRKALPPTQVKKNMYASWNGFGTYCVSSLS